MKKHKTKNMCYKKAISIISYIWLLIAFLVLVYFLKLM